MSERTELARLQEQLLVAQRENAELRVRVEQHAAGGASDVADASDSSVSSRSSLAPRGRQRWRAVVSALLIVLGAVLAPVATVGAWAHGLLTDTDRFVSVFAPLADDPAVQRLVTDEAVGMIEREVDLPALTATLIDGIEDLGAPSSAVSAARALETPINLGLTSFVRSTVETVVASDAFSTGWREVLRLSHSQLNQTLRGDPGAALAIAGDGSLGLQLGPVLASIQETLVAQGLGIAAGIPVVDMVLPIADDVSLSGVQLGYGAATVLGQWLPWVTLGLLAGGVIVARRRRRAMIGAAIGLAIGMAVLLILFAIAARLLPAMTPLPADAAEAIFSAITGPISQTAAALLTVAVLLGLVGWFSGPGSLPTRLRAMFGAVAERLRLTGDRYGVGTGAFGRWCERWQRLLRVAVAAGAGAVVLFARPLTTGLIIWTLVCAILALILLDLLRRPSVSAEPVLTQDQ